MLQYLGSDFILSPCRSSPLGFSLYTTLNRVTYELQFLAIMIFVARSLDVAFA
jgi:hypothetical protein